MGPAVQAWYAEAKKAKQVMDAPHEERLEIRSSSRVTGRISFQVAINIWQALLNSDFTFPEVCLAGSRV